MADDEVLDLVDEQDRVIGRKARRRIYARGLTGFRVMNAFVRNRAGQLWIPRRAPGKALFPGALDVSVGGHVQSGESYEEAFRRECLEEIRVDPADAPWRMLGALSPHRHGVSAFMRVYEVALDASPDYSRGDFSEWFWLEPREALERIRWGDPTKGDLLLLLNHFYG